MDSSSHTSLKTSQTSDTFRRDSITSMLVLGIVFLLAGFLAFSPNTLIASAAQEQDPSSGRELILDEGHVDAFNVVMRDGQPHLTLKEDVTGSGVVHEAEDVELVVKEEAMTDFSQESWAPEELHGTSAYHLPMVQEQGLIWPGWESGDLYDSGYETVDINIMSVEGPGEIYLWSEGTFGEAQSRLDHDGFELPGVIHQELLGHEHAHWAFTEPGSYELTVQAQAHDPETGESATTNTGSYLFTVGDEATDPDPEPTPEPSSSPTEEPTDEPTNPPPEQPTTDPSESQDPSEEPRQVCWSDERFDSGHVDAFNVTMVNGQPTLTLKEDVTGQHVVRDPLDVELHIKEEALMELPDVDVVPEEVRGESTYFLPLVQDHNLLWPGWDSQGLGGSGFDTVDINIEAVDGPGDVYLWSSGGQSLLADDGYQLPGTIDQDFLAHVHANWAFTEPGAYYFTVSAEVTNSETGDTAETNTAQYLFTVGDNLPDDYLECRDDVPEPITTPDPTPSDPIMTESPDPTGSPEDNDSGNTNGGSDDDGPERGSNGAGDSGTGGSGNGSSGSGAETGNGSSGSGGAENGSGGSLAQTGFSSTLLIAAGAGLLALGGGSALLMGSHRLREERYILS